MITVDLTQNIKQAEYFITSMAAAQKANPYKVLGYGGGVRGGKTFVTLAILLRLCNIFPDSRWHIIREDFPKLDSTTIPSFEKILGGSDNWVSNRKIGNFHYTCRKTGAKIFFKSENIKADPTLDWMNGLETNGIFLEQAEELHIKTFHKALERCGSWYLPKMPRGLIFLTFNPNQLWVRQMIYDRWVDNTLPPEYYYQTALPSDNPFVTADQYEGWNMMAERYRNQFVEGDWSDFDSEEGRWLFAFNEKNHVGTVEWQPDEPTYLSFDFNRNPIVCSIWQHLDEQIRCVRVIKLADSTIYRLCQEIDKYCPDGYFFVTGDASGSVPTTISNLDNFSVIRNYFRLSSSQMRVSKMNPRLEDSRMLCNSIFEQLPVIIDKDNAAPLIYDAKHVKASSNNTILKDNRKIESQQADTLDTMRYYLNTWFKDYMKFMS